MQMRVRVLRSISAPNVNYSELHGRAGVVPGYVAPPVEKPASVVAGKKAKE
jgi:hypothetical protein